MIKSYVGYDDSGEIISCITSNCDVKEAEKERNNWPNVIEGYAIPWEHYIKNDEILLRPEMDVKIIDDKVINAPKGAIIMINNIGYEMDNAIFSLHEIQKNTHIKVIKFPYKDFSFLFQGD